MKFTTPIPFAEALEKFRERKILPTGLGTAELRMIPVELRERAFFSARVESARLLQAMKDYQDDFLAVARMENGGLKAHSRAEFVANMREIAIREGLGKIDPATGRINPNIAESDLTDIRSIARLELIFDTQIEAAQEYGYYAQGQDEAILDVFPAQRFIRVRPVQAPRDYHAANEGAIRRKDDVKFWLSMNRDFGVPWGPWGFNSGMGVEDVDREEAIAAGVMKESDTVKPVKRKPNEGLEASVRGLDGGILAALARSTGGAVAGGRIKARETKFKEMVLTDPDGKGTLYLPDDIYESLRDLTAGKSWGAADVFAGLTTAKITKYRATEAKELRGAAVEEGLLLDRDGEPHRETGGKKRIKWPNELLPGALMSHTHPAGSSFSVEDVEGLLIFGMKGVRAITEKRIFSVRPGSIALPLANAGELAHTREFKQAHREAIAVMRAALSSESTTDEREELLTRLVWARLHQMGIIEYQEESWDK